MSLGDTIPPKKGFAYGFSPSWGDPSLQICYLVLPSGWLPFPQSDWLPFPRPFAIGTISRKGHIG